MTDWYEAPYETGPAVAVKGFPRPLYPPDVATNGKTPSVDGPDVKALKRALCRGGRWGDWNPESWDEAYSNGFAHGKGGNVKDTGIEGFQRQQHIDASGWFGKASFDSLLRARISDPAAPRFGEPLLDSVCVQLLNQAFDRFGGHEPEPEDRRTVRGAALRRAKNQIGQKESPSGSNNNKYGAWYGMNGVPWCAIFCTWSFELGAEDVGKQAPSFVRGSRYSYVPYVVSDARANRNGLRTTDDPIAGDLVCYDWAGDTVYDHIGIFEGWVMGAGDFNAVEGNTSTSNNSNGGEVMRRTRNKTRQGTVFVRVSEP